MILLAITAFLLAAQPTEAAIIYRNDFGAPAQRLELTITGENPAWDDADSSWDRDGDGLAGLARRSAGQGTTDIKKLIHAPRGKLVSYPVFSCRAAGSPPNWATGVTVYLSIDGTTWEHSGSLATQTASGIRISASAASDPKYRGLESFWIRAELKDLSGSDCPEGWQARAWDFEATGDITEAFDYRQTGLYAWPACPSRVAYDHITRAGTTGYNEGKLNFPVLYSFDRDFNEPLQKVKDRTDAFLATLHPSITRICLGEENLYWGSAVTNLNALYDHIKTNYPGLQVYQWLTPGGGQEYPKAIHADGFILDEYKFERDRFRRMIARYHVLGKPVVNVMWASNSDESGYGGWEELMRCTVDQLGVCKEFNVMPQFFAVEFYRERPGDSLNGRVDYWLTRAQKDCVAFRELLYGRGYDYAARPCDFKGLALECAETDTSALPAPSANDLQGADIVVSGGRQYIDDYNASGTGYNWSNNVTIGGLLNLRYDYRNGKMITESKPQIRNAVNESSMTYRFTSGVTLRNISANIIGTIKGPGARVSIDISGDGKTWVGLQSSSGPAGPPAGFNLNASGGSIAGASIHVRIRAAVPDSGDAHVALDNFQFNYAR